MRIIVNDYLPVGRHFAAINLFGVLFVKRGVPLTPELINHESIHTRQIQELLYVPFYIIYLMEWALRLFQCRFNGIEAYSRISFEREAYRHGDDLGYLARRRPFAMWRR